MNQNTEFTSRKEWKFGKKDMVYYVMLMEFCMSIRKFNLSFQEYKSRNLTWDIEHWRGDWEKELDTQPDGYEIATYKSFPICELCQKVVKIEPYRYKEKLICGDCLNKRTYKL